MGPTGNAHTDQHQPSRSAGLAPPVSPCVTDVLSKPQHSSVLGNRAQKMKLCPGVPAGPEPAAAASSRRAAARVSAAPLARAMRSLLATAPVSHTAMRGS